MKQKKIVVILKRICIACRRKNREDGYDMQHRIGLKIRPFQVIKVRIHRIIQIVNADAPYTFTMFTVLDGKRGIQT